MTNGKAPHKAVIHMHIQVHEVNKTGECTGKLVTKEELAQVGIQPKILLTINGFDKFECLKKLRNILNEFDTK